MNASRSFRSGDDAESDDPPPSLPSPASQSRETARLAPRVLWGEPLMIGIAQQAADLCGATAALVGLLEGDVERTIARVGIEVAAPVSICGYAIHEPDVLAVDDLRRDPRFYDDPLVVGEPFLRFYAGAPIFDETGLPLGSLCVVDAEPHDVSSQSLLAFRKLADLAGAALQVRLASEDPRGLSIVSEEAEAHRR